MDPMQDSSTDPDSWYIGNTWVYAWLSFFQFEHLGVSTASTYSCHKCTCKSSLESKGYFYQPMFEQNKITWVIHRQFKFKCCHTTSTLSPNLLSQLPTNVVKRLLYVTKNVGPGMHKSLVQMLCFLCKNKVLFTTTMN